MERRFGLTGHNTSPQDAFEIQDRASSEEGIGWPELLQSRRVLLIAEAGAGKTHECREQAGTLFQRGEAAFFLRLEEVASKGVDTCLYGDRLRRFRDWRASSSQMGYYFLDSIDELQLVHGSFRDALDRLAQDLQGALGRATVVVTSRPVAIDRRAFAELLPVPLPATDGADSEEFVRFAVHGSQDESKDQPPVFREVRLLALDDPQIVEFARGQSVSTPEALLAAIHARHAGDFARRPQDLIELCDGWRDHGQIRSHYEQVKSHIRARLGARADRKEKADLSEEKARQGVQRLSLAAMLGRRLTIRHSAGADAEDSGDVPIDPRVLLQDWNAKEIVTLLERPIFSEGGYGRVRFHHRSVLEFLAASQIHYLIESGTLALSAAKRMLFSMSDTQARLPKPSLRPVAGWLAMLRSDIFATVLAVEPSTLLMHGDPESLGESQCERALLAFIERYGKGQWRGLDIPELQLARLASKPLSGVILTAWQTGIENPEVRELLVRLVSAGRYVQCANLAAAIAEDTAAGDRERFEALVALSQLCDPRLAPLLESAVTLAPGWTVRIARWIAMRLYPEHVSDDQLLRLLENIQHESRRDDYFASDIARVIERAELGTDRLEALLPGLLALTRSLVVVADDELVDGSGRLQASRILRSLCIRLLERASGVANLIEACVLAYRAAGESARRGGREGRLALLVNALPHARRRQVFEADHDCIAQMDARRNPLLTFGRLVFDGPLSYSYELDGQWVLEALSNAATHSELRAVLLQTAAFLVPTTEGDDSRLDALRDAVSDSSELMEQLTQILASRKPSPEFVKMQEQQRKREERQRLRLTNEKEEWAAFWSELAERSALALAPGRLNSTVWNLSIVLRKNSRGSGEERWDRAFLEKHFGCEATDALRRGLMSYWRSMKPTLRRERKTGEKNTYLVVWSIGLMGLYAEAEDPNWASTLGADEAELAVRYALLELNGLPNWLATLVSAHPATVERVLAAELEDELKEPPGESGWHSMLLQGLQHGCREVARLMQSHLSSWLEGAGAALMQQPHNQANEAKLDQAMRVLLTHGDEAVHCSLEELAAKQAVAAGLEPYFFFWLPVLFRLNANRGAAMLLELLDELPVERRGVAVRAIGSLFSERRVEGATNWSKELSADMLLKLTRAIHHHVRPEDDIEHLKVYSPDFRDRAEDGRRYVFDALIQASGPEALRAKLALASDPMFARLKDRIAALAHERLAEDADASVAEMSELAELFLGGELPPKTGADMAHLLADRLDDLQELMLRDAGPRAAWAMVSDENTLRPAIARELEVMAKGAYTVDQEAVTADGKETDIRLRSLSLHQATIELKIGEKSRSGKVLRDTVEDQLVKKYMAHCMARTGCLLVTVSNSNKRWQHPETKALMDRIQLQEMLNEAAQLAQQRLGGEARVMARVLDLTPRLGTEATSASTGAATSPRPCRNRKTKLVQPACRKN